MFDSENKVGFFKISSFLFGIWERKVFPTSGIENEDFPDFKMEIFRSLTQAILPGSHTPEVEADHQKAYADGFVDTPFPEYR